MRKKIALILCILFIIPFLTGCGESLKFWKKKKEVEVVNKKLPPFEDLFNRTIEMYNAKQYKDAIQALLFLRENYPRKEKYQSRITLYLADSHYNLKEYPEAIANYEEFIKLYPTSPDIPYAYFQIGMSNYNQRRTYDRDATFIRNAIKYFKKVVEIAPPGVLVNESIRMIAFCQRELAMHDFYIADFYIRTHRYKSAIFRYEDILRRFYNLKIHDRAHLGIARAYLKLKNKNKAYRHLSYVAKNYPTTSYGKEAWKLLQKEYKVASINDLPDVTFPKIMPIGVAASEKPRPPKMETIAKPAQREKAALKPPTKPAPKKPGSKEASQTSTENPQVYLPPVTRTVKVSPKKPTPIKKTAETVKAAPAQKTASLSTHPEEPKTSTPPKKETNTKQVESKAEKVEKPSASSPTPAVQVAKTEKPKKSPQKREVRKPAPETKTPPVKTKAAEKKATQPSPKSAKVVKPAPPATPHVTVAKKKTPPPTVVEKSAPAKKKVEKTPVGSKKTFPSPKKTAKKPGKTNRPENVKEMVKTDRLPPKKQEKGSDSSLGPVGAIDTRLPIHISSDHVEAKQGKNSVKFYGNVVVTQKDVTMKCNELTAYYTPEGKAIDKIIAHGKVSITQRNKKVSCGKAIFYNAARKIILEHSPTAWDGENKLSGDKMILLLDKNEIQILGSKMKPTELVIYPDKK